jgi:hypothetical protein
VAEEEVVEVKGGAVAVEVAAAEEVEEAEEVAVEEGVVVEGVAEVAVGVLTCLLMAVADFPSPFYQGHRQIPPWLAQKTASICRRSSCRQC